MKVRSDHDMEFENEKFSEFCDTKGISHEFSHSTTSLQNGIVKQKTRTIHEPTRVMLSTKQLPLEFWAEAMRNAC